jgi:hypothetical protein
VSRELDRAKRAASEVWGRAEPNSELETLAAAVQDIAHVLGSFLAEVAKVDLTKLQEGLDELAVRLEGVEMTVGDLTMRDEPGEGR